MHADDHLAPPDAGLGRHLRGASIRARLSPWHAALVAVLGLAAALDLHRLSQNSYANIFYSAAVKSDLGSLHNLLFVSFDPGGLISVDKPPLGIWVQVASARLFGFSPLSLLIPEAIAGVLAVAVVYRVVGRRFGPAAGVTSALALAVFPSFVAVSRDNGPDPILILLMLLAAAVAVRAVETGRWRSLLGCALLVGLAFNTKTLAALLVVPGAALAYLVCGQRRLVTRAGQLAVAGVLLATVSGAWIAFVDLTPAAQRPYVGSSTDNTEVNLTFSYNGIGRVGGQVGGPGRVPIVSSLAAGRRRARSPTPSRTLRHARTSATSGVQPIPRRGHARLPSAFGGATGPLRLFSTSLGGQDGWMLPFAVFGLIAVALRVRGRRDPRLAVLIVLGGWFLIEAAVLSLSKGIVHPYYVSALAPGAAAMIGGGAWAMVDLVRAASWTGPVGWQLARVLLVPLAAIATASVQYMLLTRERYLHALVPFLFALAAVGALACVMRARWAGAGLALALGALSVAPAAYASTVWQVPVDGTFPAAGPHVYAGPGGLGVKPASLITNIRLASYVRGHHPGNRWGVLTDASDTAAPLILLGLDAGSLGGYSGTDQALSGPGLARLVALGQARYVLLGGAYASRGGNGATQAARLACAKIPSRAWRGAPGGGRNGLTLLDCRGDTASLASA